MLAGYRFFLENVVLEKYRFFVSGKEEESNGEFAPFPGTEWFVFAAWATNGTELLISSLSCADELDISYAYVRTLCIHDSSAVHFGCIDKNSLKVT